MRLRPTLAMVLLALLAALLPAAGCGSSDDDEREDESTAAQAPDELPAGRLPVIFEPGPVLPFVQRRERLMDEIVGLGVDTVRLVVFWREAAPEERPAGFDPTDSDAYELEEYDWLVEAAEERNLKLLLTISGPAPDWAAEGGDGTIRPDPEEFGEFSAAIAERYAGKVETWSVWNEPNLSLFLGPQLRDEEPYSPILYRELYLAAQDSIEEADPEAEILIGETAPTGSTDSVDPVPFAEGVLCLTGEAAAEEVCQRGEINAAGWATHPYGVAGQAPFEPPPVEDFVTIDSLAGLEAVLDTAAERGAVPEELPVYITEYGVQSRPDELIGVPLQTQAEYLAIGEYLAYADDRIRSHAQYLLFDDPPDRVEGEFYGGFETGLRFHDLAPKPSVFSFPLPLVVRREGDDVSLWGLVRRSDGPTEVEIRVQDGGRTKALRTVNTNDAGIFELESSYLDGRLWQARWTDPDGAITEGAWTRAYSFPEPE